MEMRPTVTAFLMFAAILSFIWRTRQPWTAAAFLSDGFADVEAQSASTAPKPAGPAVPASKPSSKTAAAQTIRPSFVTLASRGPLPTGIVPRTALAPKVTCAASMTVSDCCSSGVPTLVTTSNGQKAIYGE